MKLFAISDLHLDYRENRDALREMSGDPNAGLILGGDVSSSEEHLHYALEIVCQRFAKVFWVPGNHELWVSPHKSSVKKYERLVEICREYGVSTPEDPYERWEYQGESYVIAPLFTLYDYSFRPDHVEEGDAVEWANQSGILCVDEMRLKPFPYTSPQEWCHARADYTEQRLLEAGDSTPLILISHFPLRQDVIRLRRIPRFSIWCGTTRTEDWHIRFPVSVVVTGHLHMRATDYRDGVRFEEVSLGYPTHWRQNNGIHHYLREILPGPMNEDYHHAGPFWKF